MKDKLFQAHQANRQIEVINQQVERTAQQFTDQIVPLQNKLASLKDHCKELYLKLGYNEEMATYNTLCAAQEWTDLEGPVRMLMQKHPYKVSPKSKKSKKTPSKN